MYEGKHLQISKKIHTHNISTTTKTCLGFFLLYLKLNILEAKHKTLHVIWAWAKLENSTENQSARVSIDRV